MSRSTRTLVIDATARGPHGPLALEVVSGRPVLRHLIDSVGPQPARRLRVYTSISDRDAIASALRGDETGRWQMTHDAPSSDEVTLRTDRVYDPRRLRKALRSGAETEEAVLWRLDRPHLLAAAGDEIRRRTSYQPLGRFWAFPLARELAGILRDSRIRPNHLTILAALSMLSASGLVIFGGDSPFTDPSIAFLLALALLLDTADGHLARLQGTASKLGRWLDGVLDELCDVSLHAGIAWAAFSRSGNPAWLCCGMLYLGAKFLFLFSGMTFDEIAEIGPSTDVVAPGSMVGSGGVRSLVRLAGHADVRWHLWIVLALLGHLDVGLLSYSVYFTIRFVASAWGKAVRLA